MPDPIRFDNMPGAPLTLIADIQDCAHGDASSHWVDLQHVVQLQLLITRLH